MPCCIGFSVLRTPLGVFEVRHLEAARRPCGSRRANLPRLALRLFGALALGLLRLVLGLAFVPRLQVGAVLGNLIRVGELDQAPAPARLRRPPRPARRSRRSWPPGSRMRRSFSRLALRRSFSHVYVGLPSVSSSDSPASSPMVTSSPALHRALRRRLRRILPCCCSSSPALLVFIGGSFDAPGSAPDSSSASTASCSSSSSVSSVAVVPASVPRQVDRRRPM